MDAAILVVAADQPCPSPQTAEHLSAVELMGLRNLIIAQNKVDLVPEHEVRENYQEIQNFTKNTVAGNAPVIPICAQQGWNVDSLCRYITEMKLPERDIASSPLMMVVRSFDVNKPGEEDITNLQGAVGKSLPDDSFLT
jgi:translation initiation factor 2 subunit 3